MIQDKKFISKKNIFIFIVLGILIGLLAHFFKGFGMFLGMGILILWILYQYLNYLASQRNRNAKHFFYHGCCLLIFGSVGVGVATNALLSNDDSRKEHASTIKHIDKHINSNEEIIKDSTKQIETWDLLVELYGEKYAKEDKFTQAENELAKINVTIIQQLKDEIEELKGERAKYHASVQDLSTVKYLLTMVISLFAAFTIGVGGGFISKFASGEND